MLSFPPLTTKGLCLGQDDLLILDPLAIVTHFFMVFHKLSKASHLEAEIYFLFRREGKKGLEKCSLGLAFSWLFHVLVAQQEPAQLLQEPSAVCSATYSNCCNDNEMRVVEEGKQEMRQERWRSNKCGTGTTSHWINSFLTFWEGEQKSRASLIQNLVPVTLCALMNYSLCFWLLCLEKYENTFIWFYTSVSTGEVPMDSALQSSWDGQRTSQSHLQPHACKCGK